MCPPWCGSLPELLLLPNFLPCLSPIFGGCLHLCVPFCLPFVWFRSFVSCLQLCWLRWHTSTTLVLHFFLRMSSGLQGVDVHPFLPFVFHPSLLIYYWSLACSCLPFAGCSHEFFSPIISLLVSSLLLG